MKEETFDMSAPAMTKDRPSSKDTEAHAGTMSNPHSLGVTVRKVLVEDGLGASLCSPQPVKFSTLLRGTFGFLAVIVCLTAVAALIYFCVAVAEDVYQKGLAGLEWRFFLATILSAIAAISTFSIGKAFIISRK